MNNEVIVNVPFPELRKAIVALNESGELAKVNQERLQEIYGVKETKIKLVAISREDMLSAFMAAFDLIDDVDEKCPAPKEALDFYNKVIEMEEKPKEIHTGTVEKGTAEPSPDVSAFQEAIAPKTTTEEVAEPSKPARFKTEKKVPGLDFEIPLLKALIKLGGGSKPSEVYLEVEKIMGLNPTDFPKEYEKYNGHEIKWKNKARWARASLKTKGQLDSSERGVWKITEIGRSRIKE